MIKLQIIGNLGADATLKQVGEATYISYSVCHTEKNRDGKEFSTWVNVMQKTRDSNPRILPYLIKGAQVYVEGNPSVGAYLNNEGKATGSLSLWSFKVDLLGSPRDSASQNNQHHKPDHHPIEDPADTDLPF